MSESPGECRFAKGMFWGCLFSMVLWALIVAVGFMIILICGGCNGYVFGSVCGCL